MESNYRLGWNIKLTGAPSYGDLGRGSVNFFPRSFSSESSSGSCSSKRMFVLGMGYVGRFLGIQLRDHGWYVSGTCRTTTKKHHLEMLGFPTYLFDADHPDPRVLQEMSSHTHLLISIPPHPILGDPVTEKFKPGTLSMLHHMQELGHTLPNGCLRWICYLSSTGVYGECGGQWVDEDYVVNPMNDMAEMRVKAEDGWLRLGRDLRLHPLVLRLGGIYGPGRSAIDTIISGVPLSEKKKRRLSSRYTSRIHVSDICRAIEAGIMTPVRRDVYNVVDDDPTPRSVVFEYAYGLIGEKWQERTTRLGFLTETGSGPWSGGKRVRNGRMKVDLRVELLYPSYRCGLKSIIDGM